MKEKDPWNDGTTMDEKIRRMNILRDCVREFEPKQEKMKKHLMTNLAPRIYALSKKGYMGCGFHYDMEQQLGKMINKFAIGHRVSNLTMNSYPEIQNIHADIIISEVIYKELCKNVKKAERSAKAMKRNK